MDLDIRYKPLDGDEINIPDEERKVIENELKQVYGHLAVEMNKTGGYILLYTLQTKIHGMPQIINCSPNVLGEIVQIQRRETGRINLH